MERIYNRIYRLIVKHTFYKKGVSKDLSFAPFSETLEQMKPNGLIFKSEDRGFELVYKTQTGITPPLAVLSENIDLFFGANIENLNLLNFTTLPIGKNANNIYFFASNWTDENIIIELKKTRPFIFSEAYKTDFAQGILRIVDKNGAIVYEEKQTGSIDPIDNTKYNFLISINLRNRVKIGLYKIKFHNRITMALEKEEDIFIYDYANNSNLFGIFHLTLDQALDENSEKIDANINLTKTSDKWYYEITLLKSYKNHKFSLFRPDEDPEENPILVFEQRTADLETIIDSNTDPPPDYDKGDTLYFVSKENMESNEEPISDLCLTIAHGDIIKQKITGLPNPSQNNKNRKVYLKI